MRTDGGTLLARYSSWSRRAPRVEVAVLLACALVGCAVAAGSFGCGKERGKSGSVEQLRQTRLRFRPNERTATCDIVAEIENRGKLTVREVQVTATLKSKSGKSRGLNNQIVRNILPGEKRLIYMTVRAHGKFHRVELSFHELKSAR